MRIEKNVNHRIVDPIPNSLNKHLKNYSLDLGNERVKGINFYTPKFV